MIRSVTLALINRLLHARHNHPRPPTTFNLLPWWIAEQLVISKRRPGRKRRRASQLLRFPPSATLTLGLPGDRNAHCHALLGPRLFFSPRGVPSSTTLGIASSRLPRPWYRQPWWFRRLASACQFARQNSEVVVGVSGATVTRFLPACNRVHGTTSWLLRLAPQRQQLPQWLASLAGAASQTHHATRWQTWISPPLSAESCPHNPASSLPLADCLLVSLADQLKILSCRPAGRLGQVLRQLAPSTEIPVSGPLEEVRPASTISLSEQQDQPANDESILTLETANINWQDYLAHWTRDQDGPWPNELLEDWLAQLVGADPCCHHSPLDALKRIVQQQRIVASASAIRGSIPVTCFTALPVTEWQQQRVYRPHRRRWDFLPFAIGIKKSWLLSQGAEPVRYGKEADWQRLSTSQQPFFQRSASERPASPISWRQEQEWRVVGDVQLDDLSSQDGFLLAPDLATARSLQPLSRWPVISESSASADGPVLHPRFEH